MTETKKSMIQQSLDTATLFLKQFVNNHRIRNYIKPLDLYDEYKRWSVSEDKKMLMNKMSFLSKIKDFKEFITIYENKRLNGENATNYIKIDREKMISYFKVKHYWNEYDDINEFEIIDDNSTKYNTNNIDFNLTHKLSEIDTNFIKTHEFLDTAK